MSLEKLLGPAKWLDEQVLRQYTKISKNIPDKKLYKMCIPLSLAGTLGAITGASVFFDMKSIYGALIGFPSGYVCQADVSWSRKGLSGRLEEYSDSMSLDFKHELNKKLVRGVRLPTFLAGTAFLGVLFYNALTNSDIATKEIVSCAAAGLGNLAFASSMYLKDRDPKLLQKQPFWKKAYDALKDKVKALAPQPAPVPIPIPNKYEAL